MNQEKDIPVKLGRILLQNMMGALQNSPSLMFWFSFGFPFAYFVQEIYGKGKLNPFFAKIQEIFLLKASISLFFLQLIFAILKYMKRKKLILLAGILILLIILGTALVYIFNFSKKAINPLLQNTENKQEEIKLALTEWQDEAGFSFSYPKDAKVVKLNNDKDAYSELEITEPNKKGKIIITCKDSEYVTLDEWLKKDKLVMEANALDTKIATQSAKRVALGEGREIASFIDPDQVMYLIDKQPQGEVYWQKVYSAVLNSFKLTPLAGENSSDFQEWSGAGVEEVEADYVENAEVIE